MNTFMSNMKSEMNYGYTTNGAVKHTSTMNKVLDMFAMGGAYRKRSDIDCIALFKAAFDENPDLALRCLFYLRDIRGGQGERRFFRVCFKWLAQNHAQVAKNQLDHISEYGRWDDLLYATEDTSVFQYALAAIKKQFVLDIQCNAPSLLAKWLPSENASSAESKRLGGLVRKYFGMTSREYRKSLSELRRRINVLERLMSAGKWDEIEFDKIPSRAGLIYKNAFARRDLIAAKYESFAKSNDTKVNAAALYPHDVCHKAYGVERLPYDSAERLMVQKYWDNLPNFYGDNEENGLAVVDTSGSMNGQPMEVALSLGAYMAEKAHGPFANHFMTFSTKPELIEFQGVDITDKLMRAQRASWQMNTNLKAVFDLLLKVARKKNTKASDMPTRLYIISDMEFDGCVTADVGDSYWGMHNLNRYSIDTLVESIKKEWASYGYKLPQIVFWNVNATSQNIPAIGEGFSYVSGFSPSMLKQILSGKDGIDLMLEVLNSERYVNIHA